MSNQSKKSAIARTFSHISTARLITGTKPTLATASAIAALMLSSACLAWVPALDANSAKQVIDSAYGRTQTIPTYLNFDLKVQEGQFASANAIKAFEGGESCINEWLTKPYDNTKGSRPTNISVMGQADQLHFQATEARDNFKNLSAADALDAKYAGLRQEDGELRVDINVRGLPTQRARDAYVVRLRGVDGKLMKPTRRSFVDNFEQEAGSKTWKGTLVFYFKPLSQGIKANDKIDLLFRTEADTNCAYNVTVDLNAFW